MAHYESAIVALGQTLPMLAGCKNYVKIMCRAMSIIYVLFTFLFNVCLPTWDVFTDVSFAFTQIQPICNDYYEPWQYFVEKHKWKSKQYFLTEYLFGQYISKHNFDSRFLEWQ